MEATDARLLNKAIILATDAHGGQYRTATGDPYIVHPLRVMAAVEHLPVSVRIAAVLHDTVEDTSVTLGQIESQFGPEVAALVDAVTRRPGEVYADFILRVAANGPQAVAIKLADLDDNLRDLSGSLRGRYERAVAVLAGQSVNGG
jgi:(p)ppGpp synthase/HD superfamily hydrolase